MGDRGVIELFYVSRETVLDTIHIDSVTILLENGSCIHFIILINEMVHTYCQ